MLSCVFRHSNIPGMSCRRFLYCVVILVVCVYAKSQTTPNTKSQTFLISGFDGHDHPVSLEKGDIEVSLDRTPADVVELNDASGVPLDFVVAVDLSNSATTRAELIKQLTIDSFQVLSTGQNRGLLLLFNIKPQVSNRPLQLDEVKQTMQKVDFGGGTAFYDAVKLGTEAASRLPAYVNHRHAMIVISDGEDNQSTVNVDTAVDFAIAARVPVYGIYVSEKMNSPRGHDKLEKISKQTGGHLFDSLKPLDAVAKLADMVSRQYVLTVTPRAPINSDRHELHVKSAAKHVQIAAPNYCCSTE